MDERVKQAFEELAEGEAEVVEQLWNLVQAVNHAGDNMVTKQHQALKVATVLLMTFSDSAYEAIGSAEMLKQTMIDYLAQMNKERRKHE